MCWVKRNVTAEAEKSSLIFLSGTLVVVRYRKNNYVIGKLNEFLKRALTGLVFLPDYLYCSVILTNNEINISIQARG